MIRVRRVHFVGIGGSGMSGIAEILLNLGYEVTGSDLAESETIARLRRLGAKVAVGHDARHVTGGLGKAAGASGAAAEVVVYSSAVAPDNPELEAARSLRIPVIRRAEMLAEVARLKHAVAVAGTHGKTTTTTMVDAVLSAGGLDPTTIVGGVLADSGGGARLGKGRFFVLEADESDGSFLNYHPTVAVVTNIDDDHVDHYGTMEALTEAFRDFLARLPFYGFAVLPSDDPRTERLREGLARTVVTFGFDDAARGTDVAARDVVLGKRARFRLVHRGKDLGPVALSVAGRHNVLNALAAAAVGLELGVAPEAVREGLEKFRGVARRLELRGEAGGIKVVDDYGHHPTEIRAVFETLRASPGRLLVVFQPHRFSRTHALAERFAEVLALADQVFLLPVYPAGEAPIPGVGRDLILEPLVRSGAAASAVEYEGVPDAVARAARPGDTVLLLGAGNVTRLAEPVLAALCARAVGR